MKTNLDKIGTPEVKKDKSFLEIVENFTDPKEVTREAISNALDWGATNVKVKVFEDAKRADRELVIEITDNGVGLNRERFEAFWNLADSLGVVRDSFGKKAAELGKRVTVRRHSGSAERSN